MSEISWAADQQFGKLSCQNYCILCTCIFFLFQQGQRGRKGAEALEGTGATLPVGEYDDHKRLQLQEERHREYVEQQNQVWKIYERIKL